MLVFTDDGLKKQLKDTHPDSAGEIDSITFGPFKDVEEAVKSDVEYLKSAPLVLKDTVITGWVYEVETGKVLAQSL